MRFALSEEQEALRDSARASLGAFSGHARAVTETGVVPSDVDEALRAWGWFGIGIPTEYGGIDLGGVERAVVMEELGRLLVPTSFLASNAFAAAMLVRWGTEGQKERWLPGLANGTCAGAVGWGGENGHWPGVVGAASAAALILGDSQGFRLVPAGSPGLTVTARNTLDRTRPRADVWFSGVGDLVPVPPDAGALSDGMTAVAAEQLGVAQRCMDMAVEYAGVRRQFGRPIGSFQAIKHKCADLAVLVECARSAVGWAAWAGGNAEADRVVAAWTARIAAGHAGFRCAAESIQIHGGIGFTWEHDAHLFLKRARANDAMFGSVEHAHAQVAASVGF